MTPDPTSFYEKLLETQQNNFNTTLTVIGIISGAIIALISIWGFIASRQQITSIAQRIIEKETKKNELLTNARTYLLFSDLFYNNKQYEAASSLQLLSFINFLKAGDYKSALKSVDPIEQRALVGLDIKKVYEYLNYFGYDYRDLPQDIDKYDKANLIEKKAFGTFKNLVEKLVE